MFDLDAIRARLQAATPGPWTAEHLDRDWHWPGIPRSQLRDNREFIAHAPEDVSALLGEVERLQFQFDQQRKCSTELLAEVERLRAEAGDLRDALAKGYGVMDNAEIGIIALEAENERLNIAKGMVIQLQTEVKWLRAALPDAELLKQAAVVVVDAGKQNDTGSLFLLRLGENLSTAAHRIRKIQGE